MRKFKIAVFAVLLCMGHVDTRAVETHANPNWPDAQVAAFTEGCLSGIVDPARRDYTEATRSRGPAAKPFPEEQFRASVGPMCMCFANRLAEQGKIFRAEILSSPDTRAVMDEALAGGRCKPGGLLGRMLEPGHRQIVRR
jgi:hypothetical protein